MLFVEIIITVQQTIQTDTKQFTSSMVFSAQEYVKNSWELKMYILVTGFIDMNLPPLWH